MRTLLLSKSGVNKLRSHQFELKVSDFEDSVKPVPPGEWVFMRASPSEVWLGFVNSLIDEKYSCAHILERVAANDMIDFSPVKYFEKMIRDAYNRRCRLTDYRKNCRLVYGAIDGLPGLIIDHFVNASIIQINTAGFDRYREEIRKFVSEMMGTEAYLLDNSKYREKESLPTFSNATLPDLDVLENNLKYKIRSEVLQKVGFYYDHRENRLQLMNILDRIATKPKRGIDLFCYAGAWGMSALKAGVETVSFVDQGDLSSEVSESLKLNGLSDRGVFHRSDVFKFLDEANQTNNKFDLILCDPPAFAKSALQKAQALEGYSKLHRKVFKALSENGIVTFSSCTHYVSHEEFQKNILEAAAKENRKIQLIYSGIQGLDHPVPSLINRSNYIKSYFYIVE